MIYNRGLESYSTLTYMQKTVPIPVAQIRVPVSQIRVLDEVQSRSGYDKNTLRQYREVYEDELASAEANNRKPRFPFDPVSVVPDGDTFIVFDGFHRLKDLPEDYIVDAEVFELLPDHTPLETAKALSSTSNAKHGKPRSANDKRNAIRLFLSVRDYASKANSVIAEELMVRQHLVSEVRKVWEQEMQSTLSNDRVEIPKTRIGKDGKRRAVKPATQKSKDKTTSIKPSVPVEPEGESTSNTVSGKPQDSSQQSQDNGAELSAVLEKLNALVPIANDLTATLPNISSLLTDEGIERLLSVNKTAVDSLIRFAEVYAPIIAGCKRKLAEKQPQ